MGKTTDRVAVELHAMKKISLRATLVLLSREHHTYQAWHTDYASTSKLHVEQFLFQKLHESTAGFTAIPNNSKLIFYCNWSPCVVCTDLIKSTVNMILKCTNCEYLSFSFVFHEFYAKDKCPFSDKVSKYEIWESAQKAEAAYQKLAEEMNREHGRLIKYDCVVTHEDGTMSRGNKVVPRLQIRHVSRTHHSLDLMTMSSTTKTDPLTYQLKLGS